MAGDEHVETVELSDGPHLIRSLARAVVTGPVRRGATLSTRTLVQRGVRTDRDHLAAFVRVCGGRFGDVLPPTYLHLAAFPLSVHLMAARDFPFPLVGLIHVANLVTHHRPVTADEPVDLEVRLADLRPHRKGRQFDVVADATVAGEPVWSSRSTYLRRGGGGSGAEAADEAAGAGGIDVEVPPLTAVWRVPGDIGRRYAAVSGDRNPIHVSALTARALGFPRAIAHGMWTEARCLAALEGELPDAFDVDVTFRRPVLLPATVEYATQARGPDRIVVLRSRSGTGHLAGLVTPI